MSEIVKTWLEFVESHTKPPITKGKLIKGIDEFKIYSIPVEALVSFTRKIDGVWAKWDYEALIEDEDEIKNEIIYVEENGEPLFYTTCYRRALFRLFEDVYKRVFYHEGVED